MFNEQIFFRHVMLHDYNRDMMGGARPTSPRNVDQTVELKLQPIYSVMIKTANDKAWLATTSLKGFLKFAQRQLGYNPVPDVPDLEIYGIKINPEINGEDVVTDESTWKIIKNSTRQYDITVLFMASASSADQRGGEEEYMVGSKRPLSMDLQLETISHLHDRVKTLENYLV